MSAWVLVPSLTALREEFNAVSPKRDKGADGSIADDNHSLASDHAADEDSRILRDHDPDNKNEVHAIDIDTSGPWPSPDWFKNKFLTIIELERAKWLDPNDMCRLNYGIYNRKIYDKDNNFIPVDYHGSNDPHIGHAHFSARYETRAENDTRSWGVKERFVEDMTESELREIVRQECDYALRNWKEENPDSTTTPKEKGRVGGWIRMMEQRERNRFADVDTDFSNIDAKLDSILSKLP
jgi:hypothetical protein